MGSNLMSKRVGFHCPRNLVVLNLKGASEVSYSGCRILVSCLGNICEDNEEGRESTVDCEATM